ncbi:MAG: DUF4249 family protein [Prolixibacteraceae bacterium]|jgi:hypothetical protein|nr:DUF4249 family protein [Prolixibacteraceae bacterium]
MKNAFFALFVIVVISLSSCIETVTVDSVQPTNILVVNCLISPDTVFSCNVSSIYAVNDSSDHYVTNATVDIYNNETDKLVCELQHDSAGVYVAENVAPAEGITYRIEVSVDNYPIVTGTTTIPRKQEANNVGIVQYAGYESPPNSDYSELRFTVDDQYVEANYYEAVFSVFISSNKDYLMEGNRYVEKITFNDSVYHISDANGFSDFTLVDAVIRTEGLMEYNPSTLVLSDNLFNYSEHSFSIRSNVLSGSAYSFVMYSLNEDLYKFRSTLFQHLYEQGAKGISRLDDLAGLDFSSKAIDVYSNLSGGYGIFAGYTTQILYSKFDIVEIRNVMDLVYSEVEQKLDTVWSEPYYDKRTHYDTLFDGRTICFLNQTTNPYEQD